ncbi:MAG: PAC2 family protein [Candidatus Tectomicrobia bacterium]|uniref:PAC2 family protein n=1 Tax=Tectimicrobiota bacterium TaxID=2528274 RepID=A0A932HYR8_UNCTE|nr:PAC2 family protein [Candidatus Tectomicrobia bacterium]
MDHLHIEEVPPLRSPTLLMAFAGWNDASSAATTAASFIAQEVGGRRFAHIESDIFYNFQDMRPLVTLDERGMRKITWPSNAFYACRTPNLDHDLVVFLGVEPHLQWKRFSGLVLDMARRLNVRIVVTLGALLADVYHGASVRITGSSTNPELRERLGLRPSRYEGPTGIVGILNSLFKDENLPAVSVWANTPHYVNVSPNPKAALALIERMSDFLSIAFDVSGLVAGTREFEEKVDQALASNQAVRDYVEQLRLRSGDEEEPGDLPSGEDLARELEKYLRERRRGEGGEKPGEKG